MEQNAGRLTALAFGQQTMPFVLTVAGLDPSGGAGVLADIKTFQCEGVYGLGVITCNTIQTDEAFFQLEWQKEDMIVSSISQLNARFAIRAVKIGAVRDRDMLQRILRQIHGDLPQAAVIWDPVFGTSAGRSFFRFDREELKGSFRKEWAGILKACTVITPNAHEAATLGQLTGVCKNPPINYQLSSLDPIAMQLAYQAAILLKGGHLENCPPADSLYYKRPAENEVQVLRLNGINHFSKEETAGIEKHGSGCVHSSLLTAKLAKGVLLDEAAMTVKYSMEEFLYSSTGKLGIHAVVRQPGTKQLKTEKRY